MATSRSGQPRLAADLRWVFVTSGRERRSRLLRSWAMESRWCSELALPRRSSSRSSPDNESDHQRGLVGRHVNEAMSLAEVGLPAYPKQSCQRAAAPCREGWSE